MTRDVVLTKRAERDLASQYEWYAANSVLAAHRWHDRTIDMLASLAQNPESHPLALECEEFPVSLRQFAYGSGRQLTHRIVFAVRPDKVVVYAIRHLAQSELSLDDF